MSNTTDLMEMAESLLEINEPETVEETEEATLEEGTELEETSEEEVDDVEAETDEAEEAEAEEAEADDTEDDTEEDDGDEEPHLDTFTVKVDGEEVAVTLDDLKRSYSGQSFIQKGMEENALARKEVEQAQQTLQAEYQRFAEFAKQVQEQGLQPEPQRPDPAMARTDPLGYVEAQAQYETELNAYNAQKAEIDRMKAQESERQAQSQQAYMAEQVKRLQERVPEFADPEKAAKIKDKLLEVGRGYYGLDDNQLSMISGSAAAVEVLNDARKYRELVAGKAQAKKKPPAPRNVKPKAKRVNVKAQERQKQKAQAIKSGKIDDFVDLMIAG